MPNQLYAPMQRLELQTAAATEDGMRDNSEMSAEDC